MYRPSSSGKVTCLWVTLWRLPENISTVVRSFLAWIDASEPSTGTGLVAGCNAMRRPSERGRKGRKNDGCNDAGRNFVGIWARNQRGIRRRTAGSRRRDAGGPAGIALIYPSGVAIFAGDRAPASYWQVAVLPEGWRLRGPGGLADLAFVHPDRLLR